MDLRNAEHLQLGHGTLLHVFVPGHLVQPHSEPAHQRLHGVEVRSVGQDEDIHRAGRRAAQDGGEQTPHHHLREGVKRSLRAQNGVDHVLARSFRLHLFLGWVTCCFTFLGRLNEAAEAPALGVTVVDAIIAFAVYGLQLLADFPFMPNLLHGGEVGGVVVCEHE